MPAKILPAGFITPMLPTLVDEAPDGAEWIHEIKYDGYRTQLAIEDQAARAFTRNGHDWTDKYAQVVKSALALRCQSAIIDGELCVQNAAGTTDFRALRSAIKGSAGRLVLFAFDLLMLNGRDLRAEPLTARRKRLQDLIGVDIVTRIHFSGEHVGEGPALLGAADQHGLEGIVSKRADSRYRSGRVETWLKVKSFTVGDYAVLGVERSSTGIPVALLAITGKSPEYVGNAMITLPEKERDKLWSSVERLGTPQARLAGLAKNKKASWVREGVVARMRHLRGEEKLRHASMQSLSEGKPAGSDLGERHGGDE